MSDRPATDEDAVAAEFHRQFGQRPDPELRRSAMFDGQLPGYRRWLIASIAAGAILDWRGFVTLAVPRLDDPDPRQVMRRRLFDLFPYYTYRWHRVARYFCNHFCGEAFDDWAQACVEQGKDLNPAAFLRPPSPEVQAELDRVEPDPDHLQRVIDALSRAVSDPEERKALQVRLRKELGGSAPSNETDLG